MQRVTNGLGPEFDGMEQALQKDFLPALFGDFALVGDNLPRRLACLPVKKAGLAIPNPTTTAGDNWTATTVMCGHLIAAIHGTVESRSADHSAVMAAGKVKTQERKLSESTATLKTILSNLPDGQSRTIRRGEQTGAWLSVLPSTVNGTELSAQEFRDALLMRYGIAPPDLPACCDGCEAHFTLQHALGCKKGGLVIFCHNEIRDELVHLAGKALTPSAIRDEPLIRPCRNADKENTCPTRPTSEKPASKDDRGDILLRGFWARGTDCIVDVRVTDTDAKSYRHRDPAKVIATQEREKKTEIPRALPRATPSFYTFCPLHRWFARS